MNLKKPSLASSLLQRGIAMTEYLIILAVVAIAAITVVSLFGKQIKTVFSNSNDALGGNKGQSANVDSSSKVEADTVKTGTDKGDVSDK